MASLVQIMSGKAPNTTTRFHEVVCHTASDGGTIIHGFQENASVVFYFSEHTGKSAMTTGGGYAPAYQTSAVAAVASVPELRPLLEADHAAAAAAFGVTPQTLQRLSALASREDHASPPG